MPSSGGETQDQCVVHPAQCGYGPLPKPFPGPYPGLPTPTSTPEFVDPFTITADIISNPYSDGHHAVDYAVAEGTEISASGQGLVVVTDPCLLDSCDEAERSDATNGGWGTMIIVEYGYDSLPENVRTALNLQPGQSLYVLYGHLSQINVKVGDVVNAGDIIGESGNTGDSHGSHLHGEFQIGSSGQLWDDTFCSPTCQPASTTYNHWYGLTPVNPALVWGQE